VDPVRVAQRSVDGRRLGGELAAVRVYRGRPSPDHQPEAARVSNRQAGIRGLGYQDRQGLS